MAFKTKKRKKTTRFRGYRSHSRGFKKKARGSGHRGGVGMAGTGKRGDARKTLIINLFGNDYFGKDKALRRGNKPIKLQVIDVQRISENITSFVEQGKAKDNKGTYELNLKAYKLLFYMIFMPNALRTLLDITLEEAVEVMKLGENYDSRRNYQLRKRRNCQDID